MMEGILSRIGLARKRDFDDLLESYQSLESLSEKQNMAIQGLKSGSQTSDSIIPEIIRITRNKYSDEEIIKFVKERYPLY